MVDQYTVVVMSKNKASIGEHELGCMLGFMQHFMPTRYGNPYRWRYSCDEEIPHIGATLVIRALDRETADLTASQLQGLVERMQFDDVIVLNPKVSECPDPERMQEPIGKMCATIRF